MHHLASSGSPQQHHYRDDCSSELLEWGARVAAANSRPPANDNGPVL